jgi:hypothetical protein
VAMATGFHFTMASPEDNLPLSIMKYTFPVIPRFVSIPFLKNKLVNNQITYLTERTGRVE